MKGKFIVGLVTLAILMASGLATASQIDNEYVYAISKALFDNYSFAELEQMYERDVMHAAEKLGFDRELTEAEVVKLRCIIGAIEMPHVSPLWHEGYTPTPTGQPARPEITLGKVDGSNAFDLVWQNDGVADSAEYAISDIATTGPSNDLDNDGLPEIVVTCKKYPTPEIVSKVVVFENTADDTYAQVWYHDFTKDTFTPGPPDTSFIRATRVELGDLDGDGDLDIIVGTRCYVSGKTDFGCVQVFAWDGVNGSDNYGTDPATTYDLDMTGSQWCTAMATGYIDEDPALELIVAENVDNYAYMLDITGILGGAVTWNQEYCDSFGSGSPYAAAVGDCDNDGQMEFYITRWNWVQFHTYEWESVGDTITHYGYIRLEPVDDYSWEGTKVANFDGNDYSEVYITSTVGDLWVMTNTGDVGAADSNKVHASGIALFGADVGDQDHGAGSDGGDIYVAAAGGDLFDYEFTGADVTDIGSYTVYNIHQDPNSISNLMVTVGDSLDKDGEHEVVIGNSEAIQNPSLFVIEHGEFALHDVGVQAISPSFSTVGQSNVQATIKNFGASDETDIDLYWMTDTGDADTATIDTLLSQEERDINLGWTPDTTGLVNMTAWTVLLGDENALNDTSSRNIYVYPPESGQYTYEYFTESPTRVRGLGVFGNDDYVVGVTNTGNFSLEYYHTAPGPVDVTVSQWSDLDTTIAFWWHWGIGIDTLNNVYLCNQSEDSTSQALVFDYDGNEVDFLKLGYSDKFGGKGTTYPSALDLDANGYVYVAWYWPDTTVHKYVEIYPPMASWVNHQATPVTSFNAGLDPGPVDVCEGLCIKEDGTVMWVTQRSAPGSLGDITRWTGTPVGGYTQDMSFAGDGDLQIPGYVRGIDLGPDGNIYMCSDANAVFDQEKILIADATTGELKNTIDIDSPGSTHRSPYDVEFSTVGLIVAGAQKAEDDVYLSWSAPPAATALYVAHRYGWYVDKWEGPGFKAITSYDVYRDTVPDFTPGAGNFLANTANTYYLDQTAAVGNTALNHYYIVKSVGTLNYRSHSVTLGEHDRNLGNVKENIPERRITERKTR